MRRFSSSVQWKLDFANFVTQPIEFERMLDAVDKKDVFTLANRYETMYATYIQNVDRSTALIRCDTSSIWNTRYPVGQKGNLFLPIRKLSSTVVNGPISLLSVLAWFTLVPGLLTASCRY
ncbi:RNA dependent RNA polymerase [Pseudomonas phage ER16]|nr:RNA dependent RNA polymerase [Pseudomonas phage ER16]